MTQQVGTSVFRVLEQAGERWLPPEAFQVFLFHIGGTQTVLRYQPTDAYWQQIQTILDSFFSSSERAEICSRLLERTDLRTRPEFCDFLAHALAEVRLQDLAANVELGWHAPAR